ncbi:MAG: aspartate dehydrogenase, partial [Streptomycetaceae bacterium]|nr:aspartate dehydrogenase [Streptomycetaceae bacterium]
MTAALRVAVVGCGAIGSVVAAELRDGHVAGAELTGVVDPNGAPGLPLVDLATAIAGADLVVECAGLSVLAA